MKCAYCGKGIRKYTETVYVKKEPSKYDRGLQTFYYHDNEPPKTMADCQRLTNMQVVSIKRHSTYNDDDEKVKTEVVWHWTQWDRVNYLPAYGYFCSNQCAGWYAKRDIERRIQK